MDNPQEAIETKGTPLIATVDERGGDFCLVPIGCTYERDEMKPCRECQHNISEQAVFCPSCGAPYPGRDKWDGWGFEYKSEATLLGLPILHVSFKYRPNRRPVPAKGVIAIGQFAYGVVTISQFGVGVFSVSQFTVAGFALAQMAIAYSLIAQIGIFLHQGRGQLVWSLADLVRRLL